MCGLACDRKGNRHPPGIVYVATDGELCKVGKTINTISSNVKSRMSELNRKFGRKFHLVGTIFYYGCVMELERNIHESLIEYRYGGYELYRNPDIVIAQIKAMKSFNGISFKFEECK